MFQPELGVSFHTIASDRVLTEESVEAVRQSRIATLEIAAFLFQQDPQSAKKSMMKALLQSSAIRPMSIHSLFGGIHDFSLLDEAAYAKAMAHLHSGLDLAIELNAPILIVHASGEPIAPEDRERRIEQCRRGLADLGGRCRNVGKRVAVELLPRTCLGNTVEELLRILDGLDERIFGICLDTNHLMDRYRTLPDDVRRLGHRLIALHLSDYDGVDEKHQPPGKGVVEWKAFMGALREIGYAGPFNYECLPDGDTPAARVRCLEENFDWLSRL